METIFDHSPTIEELEDLFAYDARKDTICHGLTTMPFPVGEYQTWTSEKIAWFDIGLLLDLRGDCDGAAKYFIKAPEIYAEYRKVWRMMSKK